MRQFGSSGRDELAVSLPFSEIYLGFFSSSRIIDFFLENWM